jgi:hypothetical protein
LIAFAVVVIAALSLTSTYTYSASRVSLRADELQAVTFGQQYLETMRQRVRGGVTSAPAPATQPVDNGYAILSGVGNYPSPGPSPAPAPAQLASTENFTATGSITQIGSSNDYDVRVDVTWLYSNVTQTVTLGTVVASEAP